MLEETYDAFLSSSHLKAAWLWDLFVSEIFASAAASNSDDLYHGNRHSHARVFVLQYRALSPGRGKKGKGAIEQRNS